MSKYWLTALCALCLATGPAWAQGNGEGEEGAEKAKNKVIETLNKVKKLMREIEQDLSTAGIDPDKRKHAQIRKYIQEQIDQGRKAEEVKAEIEKLLKAGDDMRKAGKSSKEIREEIEKLMKQSGQASAGAVREIEKLLEADKDIKQSVQEIEKLIKGADKAGGAIEQIDKLFEKAGGKQKQALERMKILIEQAKKMQSQQKPGGKPKDQQEQEKKDQKKEKEGEEPPKKDLTKPDDPKKKPPTPDDQIERWGDLPNKAFPRSGAGDDEVLPSKYRRLIEAYRKSVRDKVQR